MLQCPPASHKGNLTATNEIEVGFFHQERICAAANETLTPQKLLNQENIERGNHLKK